MIFVILRILIGLIFIVSGGEKLIWPWQNFLYVIQGYQLVPAGLDELIAHVFPWFEFILGVFMLLGFWLPWTLRGVAVCLLTFILLVGQAIIRQLPLSECGCFGSLISFPLHVVILFDSCLLGLTLWTLLNIRKAEAVSLDGYFAK